MSDIGDKFVERTSICDMALPRSLKASASGIDQAEIALTNLKWTHEELAGELLISRPTIFKFFAGKPVSRKLFVEICEKLSLAWQEVAELSIAATAIPTATKDLPVKVLISYDRAERVDSSLAKSLYDGLSQSQSYWFEREPSTLEGQQWVEWVSQQIDHATYIIVLLSSSSVRSEMVKQEIEIASHHFQERGTPKLLPVRLSYRESFEYPLSEYLNDLNWVFWQGEQDTPSLIEILDRAIKGSSLPVQTQADKQQILQSSSQGSVSNAEPIQQSFPLQTIPSIRLELPESGTMSLESPFYVERPEDGIALSVIQSEGVTLTIKGARQMGKSSLLKRIRERARSIGKQAIFLDFQMLFDQDTLHNSDDFFLQFCLAVTYDLGLDDETEKYWQRKEGNRRRCSRYFRQYILPSLRQPLVLAMDEVDSLLGSPLCTDFSSMLRSWHNRRADSPLWRKLDLALVISTEPYYLINDPHQSPFNVGVELALREFSVEQVQSLNECHGSPLISTQVDQLMDLVNGQPYLVRLALYFLASDQITPNKLFDLGHATSDQGPFGSHLRSLLFRIHRRPSLVEALRQVVHNRCCSDEYQLQNLRRAGLVKDDETVARCRLYEVYFQKYLHG